MSNVCCAEKHYSHLYAGAGGSGKKNPRGIDIPPRTLFSRPAKLSDTVTTDLNPNQYSDMLDKTLAEDALFQKLFPCNTGEYDEDSDDPYSSDEFRMYEFKVRRCVRNRSHDWTGCPFAHPGEKARRRDPRRYHYSGNVCPDFRRGGCSRGDDCEFAHGVFECWLHPARYRTKVCNDGKNCKRKVCFFAHTPRQLRVLPLHTQAQSHNSCSSNHCCVLCNSSVASSPTCTLMGVSHFSPPVSPPLSPPVDARSGDGSRAASSPLSQYGYDSISLNQLFPGALNYKNALADVVSFLEAMDLGGGGGGASPPPPPMENGNLQDQQLFDISDCAPAKAQAENSSGSRNWFDSYVLSEFNNSINCLMDESMNNNSAWSCPDLEWVNELVM